MGDYAVGCADFPRLAGRELQVNIGNNLPEMYYSSGHALRLQPEVIEQILTHLGLWPTTAHSPPAGHSLPLSRQRVIAA